MMSKFEKFNDDELQMIKRAFIESSYSIVMTGKYNDDEADIHTKLLSEAIEEIKFRA